MRIALTLGILGSTTMTGQKNSQTINGSANLQNQTFTSLTVNGRLEFAKLTVKEKLHVNGSASGGGLESKKVIINGSGDIKKSTLGSLGVNGSGSLEDVHITQNLIINGSATAQKFSVAGSTHVWGDCRFTRATLQSVQLNSSRATFSDSSMTSVYVKKLHTSYWTKLLEQIFGEKTQTQQVLILKDNTIVSDDVSFESGKGEIHVYDTSEVKGKVSGAKVFHFV